jgi:hypothetical protein
MWTEADAIVSAVQRSLDTLGIHDGALPCAILRASVFASTIKV